MEVWWFSFVLIVFTTLSSFAKSANILYIAPLPSPSHHIWNKALSLGLIENGHNITMLNHDVDNSNIRNFNVITITGMYEYIQELYKVEDEADAATSPPILVLIKFMYDFVWTICDYDIKSEGLQTLLNYPPDYKFDLIIFDVTVGYCLYPIIERFHNPPVVGVTPFLIPPVFSYNFGNSLHSSYIPHYASEFSTKMNLFERILNYVYMHFQVFYHNYISMPGLYEISKKKFGTNVRSLDEYERNISLILANADPITYFPIPLPPNIISVGGLHIKPAVQLPTDLQAIMDNSKHGVILFSLGTNMRSDSLKRQQIEAILDKLGKLKETVLWKYESDNLEHVPKNVILRKWLPQNDILGHRNVKLFISHGGALSTQESVYHGVPVVCSPIFSDQHTNCKLMVDRGLAKRVNLKDLGTEQFYETIVEVLSSSSFVANMKRKSELYRDQPQTSLEKAVFWTEYVLRHGSAEHLGLPSRDMPFYQTQSLDVLVVLVLGLISAYSIVVMAILACRFFYRLKTNSKKVV